MARTDVKHPEHGKPLTAEDCNRVLEREVKMRDQAIPIYEKAGRKDLAEKERHEKEIIQAYLQSTQMSDDDLRAIIERLVAEHGKEFRRVMPLAARETRGKADGGRVQRMVKELTQ